MAYLKTQDKAIEELADLIERERCCLLCFEADPNFCHRSYVAQSVATQIGVSLLIAHLKVPTLARVASR